MDNPQDLVSVYKAANVPEAHMLKNLLADDGIEAHVSEQNEPLAGLPIAAQDVLVRRADEDKARALVAEHQKRQKQRAARPDWVCTQCGETNLGAADLCDNCGAPRPGSENESASESEQ